mgnify:CR=1 FL=1
MTTRVSVVGANGRVGSALVRHLADSYDVVAIERSPSESPVDIATRAVDGVDVVVNAAGVAHLEQPTPADLERLRVGNIDLPLALADAALRERAHLIHISSVKATADATTEYGQSKYEADRRLEAEFGSRFAEAGLSLVIVRPLALLFPPFDAGKIARLRFLRYWPSVLMPPVRLPVLAPMVFLDAVAEALDTIAERGSGHRDFERHERGTLANVRRAFRSHRCATEGNREG